MTNSITINSLTTTITNDEAIALLSALTAVTPGQVAALGCVEHAAALITLREKMIATEFTF